MTAVVQTRSKWSVDSEGATCTGEAVDRNGNVLARAHIQVTHAIALDIESVMHASHAELKKEIEFQAEATARRVAELAAASVQESPKP